MRLPETKSQAVGGLCLHTARPPLLTVGYRRPSASLEDTRALITIQSPAYTTYFTMAAIFLKLDMLHLERKRVQCTNLVWAAAIFTATARVHLPAPVKYPDARPARCPGPSYAPSMHTRGQCNTHRHRQVVHLRHLDQCTSNPTKSLAAQAEAGQRGRQRQSAQELRVRRRPTATRRPSPLLYSHAGPSFP